MKLTLRKTSYVVYGFCFVVIALLSAIGEIGSVGMESVIDWVLVGWLASYASIFILLVGGSAYSASKEFLKITRMLSVKVPKESV